LFDPLQPVVAKHVLRDAVDCLALGGFGADRQCLSQGIGLGVRRTLEGRRQSRPAQQSPCGQGERKFAYTVPTADEDLADFVGDFDHLVRHGGRHGRHGPGQQLHLFCGFGVADFHQAEPVQQGQVLPQHALVQAAAVAAPGAVAGGDQAELAVRPDGFAGLRD